MSFIQREIDRIRAAMQHERGTPEYQRLYDAMNALEWAKDPNHIMSSCTAITGKENPEASLSAELSRLMREGPKFDKHISPTDQPSDPD